MWYRTVHATDPSQCHETCFDDSRDMRAHGDLGIQHDPKVKYSGYRLHGCASDTNGTTVGLPSSFAHLFILSISQ